jgi:hypothetical protein
MIGSEPNANFCTGIKNNLFQKISGISAHFTQNMTILGDSAPKHS